MNGKNPCGVPVTLTWVLVSRTLISPDVNTCGSLSMSHVCLRVYNLIAPLSDMHVEGTLDVFGHSG